MAPDDFLRLLADSRTVVGNSSVAIRECSYLGVPAVNIGSRRPGATAARTCSTSPHERAAIVDAARRHVDHGRYPSDHLYGDGSAGERIAETLATCALKIEKRLSY